MSDEEPVTRPPKRRRRVDRATADAAPSVVHDREAPDAPPKPKRKRSPKRQIADLEDRPNISVETQASSESEQQDAASAQTEPETLNPIASAQAGPAAYEHRPPEPEPEPESPPVPAPRIHPLDAALAVNLQLLRHSAAEETFAQHSAAALPEPSAFAFDDNESEPPFDAPDWSDDDDLAPTPLLELEEEEAPPQPALPDPPIAPAQTDTAPPRFAKAPPPPLKPVSLEYLRKARVAAQEQAAAMASPNKSIPRPGLITIATGAAAPFVALGAVLVFNQDAPARSAEVLSPASAEASAPNAQNVIQQYQIAVERIEAGRLNDGIEILRQAADAGLPMAQYRLAKLYERGEGVRRNLATAFELSQRAARGGNCRAMHDVGVFLARGEGAPQNERAAFDWFLQAAELGVADSQFNVGLLYQQGRGIDANQHEALFWFLVAARQHDLNAIDRAVLLASEMSAEDVARVGARARAFEPRAADAAANGVFDADAQSPCVSA